MQTKKIFLLFSALFLIVGGARAQYVVAKVGGGLSSAYGNTRSVGAYKAGVAYEYEIGGNWSLEAGLFYAGKGHKEKDRTVNIVDNSGAPVLDENGVQRTGKMNRTVNAQYLTLPLTLHYYVEVASQKYVVCTFGPYVAYGVGGKDKTRGNAALSGYERYYTDRNTFSVKGTHRFDLGAEIGLGFQWSQALTVGVEADLGVLKTLQPDRRNMSALLTLAYRFRTDD